MNGRDLPSDLGQQVQETIRIYALGSGGERHGQLEFKTSSGACLRVSIGVEKSPHGPVNFGYEPRDYGCADMEELRHAVTDVLTGQGLKYAGHSEGTGKVMSWLRYMRPSILTG